MHKPCLLCKKDRHTINGIRHKYCVDHLIKETLKKQKAKLKEKKLKEKERKAKAREKKQTSISTLKKRADKLYSEAIRLRDKCCVRCGKTENLQASHVKSRIHMLLRWDMQNGKALCYKCHIHWWHKEVTDAAEWFVVTYPDRSFYLNYQVNKPFKLTKEFVQEKIEELKTFIKRNQ